MTKYQIFVGEIASGNRATRLNSFSIENDTFFTLKNIEQDVLKLSLYLEKLYIESKKGDTLVVGYDFIDKNLEKISTFIHILQLSVNGIDVLKKNIKLIIDEKFLSKKINEDFLFEFMNLFNERLKIMKIQ